MSPVEINLGFLGVSLILYCIFAGADFGAGILELFLGKEKKEDQRELITHAIAPIWEANHVWLILALVILMMAFPRAYSLMSIVFHIPLTLLLFGIVLRGCAFTFRHYDAVKDRSQQAYSFIFAASSLISPFFLGVIAGGVTLGRVSFESPESSLLDPWSTIGMSGFYPAFVAPWLNVFCFAMGVFVCALFAFLAAVYLVGETDDRGLQVLFVRRAAVANSLAVLAGLLVFLSAQWDGLPLMRRFLAEPFAAASMVLATVLLAPLWWSIQKKWIPGSRIFAASQIVLILLGWFRLQYPFLIRISSSGLTVLSAAAPDVTQIQLLNALLVGCAVIFPSLFFLLRIFKLRS